MNTNTSHCEPDAENETPNEPKMQAHSAPKTSIERRMLSLLICPMTQTPLEYDSQAQELISKRAGLAFPIRNGVPIMLADAARTLTD